MGVSAIPFYHVRVDCGAIFMCKQQSFLRSRHQERFNLHKPNQTVSVSLNLNLKSQFENGLQFMSKPLLFTYN